MKLSDTELSYEERQMVENNLMRDEELLWVSKPVPRLFSAGSLGSFLFSLPWLGFIAFWTWGAAQGSAIFACFSIPFWCVGLGLFLSPWWNLRTQKRTVYLITSRRAMEVYPGLFGAVKNRVWPLESGMVESCTVRKDGSGDLVLGYEERHSRNGSHTVSRGFMNVPDVRRVEQFLYDLTEEKPEIQE